MRKTFRGAEGPLTATMELAEQAVLHELVDFPKDHRGIAMREVLLPAPEQPIDFADHFRDRLEATVSTGEGSYLVAQAGEGCIRGKHVPIAPAAAIQVAVVAEREAQEVQTCLREIGRASCRERV